MPQRISVQAEPIIINIPDLVRGNTVIKRKATLFTLIYNQSTKTVTLSWTVNSFANDNGNYGEPLPEVLVYSKEITADNNKAVNPATGEELTPNEPDLENENWTEYNIDWMGQYDFFFTIAQNQPIILHNLIKQYGEAVSVWDK